MNNETPFKPSLGNLSAYSVDVEFDGVKLNQNELPLDVPQAVKEKIIQRLLNRQWNRYPPLAPSALKEKIAAYTHFPASGILIGNGSNEMIQTAILACCDAGDTMLTVSPTFSVYSRVATAMNLKQVVVPLKEDYSFDPDGLVEKAGEADIILLASPNNPSGTVLEPAEIEAIADAAKGLVVVDEAYYEFSRLSAQGLIEKYSNIVVLRTFSKAFGAAGLRLGYLLGAPDRAGDLEKVKLPFSVGMFQQTAGDVLLDELNRDIIDTVIAERHRVFNVLDQMPGITAVPSRANFILFRPEVMDSKRLFNQLKNDGVLVRVYDGPQLDGMLRVSIGWPPENMLFLDKLRRILDEVSS